MRSIINFLTTSIAIVISLSACQKHFLDQLPAENFTTDSIFSDHDNAQAALTTVYNMLPQDQLYLSPFGAMAFTACTDEMRIPWPDKYDVLINAGAWNPSDWQVNAYWSNNYNAIRKANLFLENIAKTPMDKNEKTRWIGEAHFLRAFYYFQLIRLFGPVPIIDHVINSSEDFTQFKRDPLDKCFDFILADCDSASNVLPLNYTSDLAGRATKVASLALRSRLLLYRASPLWNGNPDYSNFVDKEGNHLFPVNADPGLWQVAATAAKQAIDESEGAGYHLYVAANNDPERSYQELFLINWNSEVLFARNQGVTWDANDLDRGAYPSGMGGWGGYSPTQQLVDAYEMDNGKNPINGYNGDGTPIINAASGYSETGYTTEDGKYWAAGIRNSYANREPRFYASVNYNGAWWAGRPLEFWYNGIDGIANSRGGIQYGYLLKKFVDSTINIAQGKWGTKTWIYFRLGELYLNYAEALNEAQGPVSDVYKYVNAIRTRAGLPGLAEDLSQATMREKIRHERRIEMAFEMQRYFDCRRWKIAPTTFSGNIYGMNTYTGSSLQDDGFYKRVVTDNRVFVVPKHYLWPVPQGEINKNQSIVQNPGW